MAPNGPSAENPNTSHGRSAKTASRERTEGPDPTATRTERCLRYINLQPKAEFPPAGARAGAPGGSEDPDPGPRPNHAFRGGPHPILDILSTHETTKLKRWVLHRPRFHFPFVPTGSSWLNQGKRRSKDLGDKRVRRGSFDSESE